MAPDRQRGLGRGLGALIPTEGSRDSLATRPSDVFFEGSSGIPRERPLSNALHARLSSAFGELPPVTDEAQAPPESDPATDLKQVPGVTYGELPLGSIRPNAQQPRQVFDEHELDELAASIELIGVLQPIIVRRVDGDPAFELIMGERRWRAAQQAGLETIPAIVRGTADDAMLRDALLENLHRAQLNPLEEAAAYEQLLNDFGCTHDELATRLSRSRPQISNTLRLLRLPATVASAVAAGALTAGHARALLGLPSEAAMTRLSERIVAEGLSVRATEDIVSNALDESVPTGRRTRARTVHPEFDALASVLADRLATRVSINMGRSKGKLTVEFSSRDDLDRILAAIKDSPDDLAEASPEAV